MKGTEFQVSDFYEELRCVKSMTKFHADALEGLLARLSAARQVSVEHNRIPYTSVYNYTIDLIVDLQDANNELHSAAARFLKDGV